MEAVIAECAALPPVEVRDADGFVDTPSSEFARLNKTVRAFAALAAVEGRDAGLIAGTLGMEGSAAAVFTPKTGGLALIGPLAAFPSAVAAGNWKSRTAIARTMPVASEAIPTGKVLGGYGTQRANA